jgi:hypothetical protein
MAGCVQGVVPYKEYVFDGSDHSCSSRGCWQYVETPTICEQMLQHVIECSDILIVVNFSSL